jgi:competence protein ComEC
MTQSYETRAQPPGHLDRPRPIGAMLDDRLLVGLVGCLLAGIVVQRPALALVGAGVLGIVRGVRWAVVAAMMVLFGGMLGMRAQEARRAIVSGPYEGLAVVAADPLPVGRGVRVTLQIDGRRYDSWIYGGARRRFVDAQVGDRVLVAGVRRPLSGRARSAPVRHVVGSFDVDLVGDRFDGTALDRANRRLRRSLRQAADSTMDPRHASLFTGLVIGDDSRQPLDMVQQFRTAGMSHLTAVSGQNVAFVLAAAGPLLRRLRPTARWMATLGVIGWFMALTRFEPSVLRAGFMAMLGASTFVLGRPQAAVRMLALTIAVVLIVDPMLAWSVGMWMSVGATWGTIALAPRIQLVLRGPEWLRLPLAVTLGAQLGVAVPTLAVFGRLPLVSIVANVLAVPVAGAVMLYGLPAGIVGGAVPALAPLVLWPAEVGTRWVATIAALAARIEPPGTISIASWGLVAIALVIAGLRGRLGGDGRSLHHG